MTFPYKERDTPKPRQLQRLEEITKEVRQLCSKPDCTPWFVYLPSKWQVYGAGGGQMRDATIAIASAAGLRTIDLTPVLKSASRLTFHAFDSHWNATARGLATKELARHLSNRIAE